LYRRHLEGYDVVYAVRVSREKETWFKLFTAKWFYRLFRWATDVDMPADTGDFRLMDRAVVDALRKMREQHRMLRAMVAWTGFRQIGVPYERAGRFAGVTKFSLGRMVRFATDGLTSFSTVPLRLASWTGFVVSFGSFLYGLYAVARHFGGVTVEGWASLAVIISFVGGVQLICVGILGEYLGRVYDEVKQRPLYIDIGFEGGCEASIHRNS
jgi:dolichol-phosphate mannosyltransferase